MSKVRLPCFLIGCVLAAFTSHAQTIFNNASNLAAGSDNTGDPVFQPGTEVLHSTPGLGVSLAQNGSYEHIGQFYVAANGIWNRSTDNGQPTVGTDYFGYAPFGVGSNTAYLGKGIKGASTNNGGKGTGRPTFGHLQLNSVGEFAVEGGMYITHSLFFNANGPGKSNLITTPNCTDADSPTNAVVFAPSAIIDGANQDNYIHGFASVADVRGSFTLPVGDLEGFPNALHPLTINGNVVGTVTARYLHGLQHAADAVGPGIQSVYSMDNWLISAPAGTSVSVTLPALALSPAEALTLRLVGWNGSQWIDLSGKPSISGCATATCSLTGTIVPTITDLAIGSTSRSVFTNGEENSLTLTVWPNPTQGRLNVAVPTGQTISRLQVLDLQGRSLIRSTKEIASLDTSILPAGTYLLEVLTAQGQTLRRHFIKQP